MRTLLFWSSGRSDPKVIEADGRASEKFNNPRTGCNLHFALLFLLFFSVRFLDVHFCPLFCIKNYLSYFLFLVCIGLFKSPSQTGQEWDREEVTRVISQIGDISQVLWWKKNSNVYLLFHTSDLLSSSWNICLILLNKKIFRKLCSLLVTVSWTTWTWEKLAWCLLVLKMQNLFFLGTFTCWLNGYFCVFFKFQWFLCHLECLSLDKPRNFP